jgi:1-acyl-sn-glycerol-3-phosphate acyltransferase
VPVRVLTDRPIQLRGSALARRILGRAGWTIDFDGLPAAQGVAIVYPHTSNWDFVVGILAKWAIGIPVAFWGKDTLFRIPLFGRWMRWIGGRPVDRHAPQGVVGQMADELRAARAAGRFLWLALAPEGTRGRVDGWRTGFYHAAVAAAVPLGLVHLDWRTHRVGISQFLQLSGEPDEDLAAIARGLGHAVGRRAALAAPIRFRSNPP